MDEVLEIGVVRRAHGIRGQVRIQLHDPQSRALESVRALAIGPSADRARRFTVAGATPLGGGHYLLALEGVADRDAAEALQGGRIYAARAHLPTLGEDEYYLADLVGCAVHGPDGEVAGTVAEVQTLAGQDFLVLARPPRPEALVPLSALSAVDLAGRRIDIDPPEGLLDLDLPEPRTGADRKDGSCP